MFLIEIAIGVFSYVLAKSLWDYVKTRAQIQGEYPIVWLAKFCTLLAVFLIIGGGTVVCLIGAFWFILTHQK